MWKKVILDSIETDYSVNECGQVRNDKTNYILKGSISKGYHMVSIYINKNPRPIGVHRLVALAFIENPNNYPFVNHIDGNPLNNNVQNLEWCTPQYNTQHAINTGLKKDFRRKGVTKYSADGVKLEEYVSLTAAASANNCSSAKITDVCKGRRKTTGGFQWRYTDEHIEHLEPTVPNPQGAKSVAQVDPITDQIIAIYPTLHTAAKAVNGQESSISHILKGDRQTKTHKGFKWILVDEIVH